MVADFEDSVLPTHTKPSTHFITAPISQPMNHPTSPRPTHSTPHHLAHHIPFHTSPPHLTSPHPAPTQPIHLIPTQPHMTPSPRAKVIETLFDAEEVTAEVRLFSHCTPQFTAHHLPVKLPHTLMHLPRTECSNS